MLKHHHFLSMGTDVLVVEEDKDHILKEKNHNITGKEKEKADFTPGCIKDEFITGKIGGVNKSNRTRGRW